MPIYSVPIIELIRTNLVNTLKAVRRTDRYHYDLTVHDDLEQLTGTGGDALAFVEMLDPEPLDNSPTLKQDWTCVFAIHLCVTQSESQTTPLERRLRTVEADVLLALGKDWTRGGYAIDTTPLQSLPMDLGSGSARGVIVQVTVQYRTAVNNPFSL